jgi:hypothetical protein
MFILSVIKKMTETVQQVYQVCVQEINKTDGLTDGWEEDRPLLIWTEAESLAINVNSILMNVQITLTTVFMQSILENSRD